MSARGDTFALCGTLVESKFRIEEVVGEGGFGVVYRGVHQGFDAPIALKCLKLPPHFDRQAQDDLVRGLREEGKLLLRLSQRTSGIVQALDVGSFIAPTGARVPYLVLEWLEGRTLASDLKARSQRGEPGRSLEEAMRLLEPAAKALGVAHQEKIAHRDIKPENLFLVGSGSDASIKILDFGIAKVFADAPVPSGQVTGGVAAFTPSYGAPEQFEQKRGASGPWTDVFAFALVLVEVVAQQRALAGDDLAVLYSAAADPVRRPTLRTLGLTSSAGVERVLAKAFAVDPSERYQEIKKFWDELCAAVAEEGDVAGRVVDTVGAHDQTALASGDAFDRTELASSTTNKRTELEPEVKIPHAPPSQLPKKRGRAGPLVAAAALVAVAIFGAKRYLGLPAEPTTRAAGSVGAVSQSAPLPAASAPISQKALPPPVEAAFREAERAWRDGDETRAIEAMQRAAKAGPEVGATQLRLALWQFERATPRAREAFAEASRLRASLDQRDADLLRAAGSLFAQPWDLAAWSRDLAKLSEKYPDDVELLLYLGYADKARLSFDAAVATFDRVLALDPELVPASLFKADVLSMKGDADGQLATYRACVAKVPAAVGCQEELVLTLGRAGKCDEMLVEAKRFASAHADLATAHEQLADALSATGAAEEAVIEALAKGLERQPPERRAIDELDYRSARAVLRGDFAEADRALGEWMSKVEGRTDQLAHAMPALRRARLYVESGQAEKAGKTAEDFLRRMGAWTEPSGGDLTMNLLPFAFRGKRIDEREFSERRDKWLTRVREKWQSAGRDTGNDFEWISWSNAYGNAIESEADAELAVAKMPALMPAALASGRWLVMDYNVGRAFLLAGRTSDALPPLARAARSCSRLSEPTLPARAALAYGMALEKSGDVAAAKTEYRKVVLAWGNARPPSTSAKEAKSRLARLR